jgi:tetratricopeptide (TPR) repeat protein
MRQIRALAFALVVLAAAVPLSSQTRSANIADAAFAAYLANDPDAIARAMRAGSAAFRTDLRAAFGRWTRAPRLSHAAFLLETALAAFDQQWPNSADLIDTGRTFIAKQPDPPGVRPAQDAFERTFHNAALVVLFTRGANDAFEDYYNALRRRVLLPGARFTSEAVAGRLDEPRLALIRATFLDSTNRFFVSASGVSGTLPVPSTVRASNRLTATETALADAMADPETMPEAALRSGYLALRLGDASRARAFLQRAVASDEVVVRYWAALVLGQALAASGQLADATLAFEAAARIAPRAQSPRVALAATFLKRGDRDRAYEWAAAARTSTDEDGDPWWFYWNGDARFLGSWLRDLRTLAALEGAS